MRHTTARMHIVIFSIGLFRGAHPEASSVPPASFTSQIAAERPVLRAIVRWMARHVLRRPANLIVLDPSTHLMFDDLDFFLLPTPLPTPAPHLKLAASARSPWRCSHRCCSSLDPQTFVVLRALIAASYIASLRDVLKGSNVDALYSWRPGCDLDAISQVQPHSTAGHIFADTRLKVSGAHEFHRLGQASIAVANDKDASRALHESLGHPGANPRNVPTGNSMAQRSWSTCG
ncbi:unnamed protein product [Parajaminaea phylloscopi]